MRNLGDDERLGRPGRDLGDEKSKRRETWEMTRDLGDESLNWETRDPRDAGYTLNLVCCSPAWNNKET